MVETASLKESVPQVAAELASLIEAKAMQMSSFFAACSATS